MKDNIKMKYNMYSVWHNKRQDNYFTPFNNIVTLLTIVSFFKLCTVSYIRYK
jgi:hypothetical protein